MRDKSSAEKGLIIIGLIPVIWLAFLFAPYLDNGIFSNFDKLLNIFDNPFDITLSESTLKTIIVFLIIYALGIGIYYSSKKNYRDGEEKGSAKC